MHNGGSVCSDFAADCAEDKDDGEDNENINCVDVNHDRNDDPETNIPSVSIFALKFKRLFLNLVLLNSSSPKMLI